MEFYLVKNEFIGVGIQSGFLPRPNGGMRMMYPVGVTLEFVGDAEQTEAAAEYNAALSKLVLGEGVTVLRDSQGRKIRVVNPTLTAALTLAPLVPRMTIQFLDDAVQDGIFTKFCKLFGKEHLRVNISIQDFKAEGSTEAFNCDMKDLEIVEQTTSKSCVIEEVVLPEQLMESWVRARVPFTGRLTVTVALDSVAVGVLFNDIFTTELIERNQSMLVNATCSDLVLVAANGAEVKGHKIFLAETSEVFRAMFESQFREGTSHRLEMPEMSEPGVRALLAFIYHRDLREALQSCDVALELFRAGDKYSISPLEKAMIQLICSKPKDWFTVDMTVRLCTFVNNLGDQEGLTGIRKKALDLFRGYCKSDKGALRSSEDFRQLLRGNTSAAVEFIITLGEFA